MKMIKVKYIKLALKKSGFSEKVIVKDGQWNYVNSNVFNLMSIPMKNVDDFIYF